jgi:hypothetical protein
MKLNSLHYRSGEEIHAGDRVRHRGHLTRIAFVIDRKEFTPEFPAEQWSHYEHGFMVREDAGEFFMLD